jgi:hypothetical protein
MASGSDPLKGYTFTEPVTFTGSSANDWYFLGATANGANIDYSLHYEDGTIVATVENVPVGDATLNFDEYGTFALDFDDSIDQAAIVTAFTGDFSSYVDFCIVLPKISIGWKGFSMANAVGEIAPGIMI